MNIFDAKMVTSSKHLSFYMFVIPDNGNILNKIEV